MISAVVDSLLGTLVKLGVRNVVCSPGSRNAQLLLSADNLPMLKKKVVVDERTAGFIALGMAQYTQCPVALICTSGTAVLNYAPAVAEAYYQGVPLIVISADRPEEWIDQDDSQTIRQAGVLRNFVKMSYDLNSEIETSDYLWYVNRLANEGFHVSTNGKAGPVHFNLHLPGRYPVKESHSKISERSIDIIRGKGKISESDLSRLADLAVGGKVLVVCGFHLPDAKLQRAVANLAKFENVCVMAETISNLHLPSDMYMVDSVLCNMTELDKNGFRPDVVISLGGALISRMLKEYLRKFIPKEHWVVGYSNNIVDCFQSLTAKIEMCPTDFINALIKKMSKIRRKTDQSGPTDYAREWKNLRLNAKERNEYFIKSKGWCDLSAFNCVLGKMPKNCNLYLSNGTSIRYAQILTSRIPHATYCNRGVSGIEGCGSTALGGSMLYPELTVLITGDMSFSYDTGLMNSGLATGKLRVIVLNNGGGDIFRFISNTSHLPSREVYFCADPNPPVHKLANAYNWEYSEASNKEDLQKALKTFFDASDKPKILNIITRESDNSSILKNFLNVN